jgi:hypothetical protein
MRRTQAEDSEEVRLLFVHSEERDSTGAGRAAQRPSRYATVQVTRARRTIVG